jgi:hypothetical protein
MNIRMLSKSRYFTTAAVTTVLLTTSGAYARPHSPPHINFDMVVSKGAATCLPNAKARVEVVSNGDVEDMYIFASGLPPKTGFDFFVIQVPKAPFGLAWYQGDVETNAEGNAFQHFKGRFNIETFAFAQGPAPAPNIFPDPPFPDATVNPTTDPVQMYHLGMWFNSFKDAQNAGCPATQTPFNGEHDAGLQVLNTSNFPDAQGPLLNLK